MRPTPLRAQGDANGKHNQNRDDSYQGRRAFTEILADRMRAGVSLPWQRDTDWDDSIALSLR